MIESLTAFLSIFFSVENRLTTMFLSAFLSATVLPGNSEIIFSTLAAQEMIANQTIFSPPLAVLLWVATVGNSLGGMVTVAIGFLAPKPIDVTHRYMRWTLAQCEKYGVVALLLSSLPIVGDMLCAVAGWLRFNLWQTILFITLGKFLRYLLCLIWLYPTVRYVL